MNRLTYEQQTKVTRTIIKAAVLMLEFGAESRLIETIAQRLGNALGVDSVEVSLIPSAIVLTTLSNKQTQSVTTTRRAHHKPINMSIVCDVQKMCYKVEQEKLDVDYVIKTMKEIKPNYYNRWLIVIMVGLSCACFSYLNGADWQGFATTFLASAVAMFVRQELARKKFVLIITFGVTAFVATLIAALAQIFNLTNTPDIVLSSSVLLLAPGFPFINSVLDAVKGYLAMGWGRWMQAVMLTAATSIGIVFAFTVLNLQGW
ncbi:threonine/serine ThrE exporter family protein [Campylobacterota bacterium DY0563]|uniref:threonine/serine ThrE exporter family protein n=1 Tax=Halarcobacter sp. TaxID=2321133 RepID=UPI002AA8C838|nr:threonine/serine exporter family protein [Halarcobacter sp.]